MPIDTKIEGNPGSVQGAAQWLRTSLGMQVSHAADQINTSRNTANAGWDGTAGQAFSAKMTGGADKAGGLASAASSAAQALDDYAAELQRAHNDMHAVRAAAATGGLTVNGDVIEEPGPAPAMPGPPPTGDAVTPASVGAYSDAATAVNRYAALVDTYNVALRDAESVRASNHAAARQVNAAWTDVRYEPLFVASDLINGAVVANLVKANASMMSKHAKFLADNAAKYAELARTAPAGASARLIYADADTALAMRTASVDATAKAAQVESKGARFGLKAGGAIALAGIAYDIYNGKPVDQAIVSGGVGFGASVAAGAVIGSFIPVPVVGTEVGALGGAVVGIFASGAVDSLYKNGIGDVGDTVKDGVSAVGDVAGAGKNLISDAWHSLF